MQLQLEFDRKAVGDDPVGEIGGRDLVFARGKQYFAAFGQVVDAQDVARPFVMGWQRSMSVRMVASWR